MMWRFFGGFLISIGIVLAAGAWAGAMFAPLYLLGDDAPMWLRVAAGLWAIGMLGGTFTIIGRP